MAQEKKRQMKKIILVLLVILASSFVLSIWSQMMFDNVIESNLGVISHLNNAMKYKDLLFYCMIAGSLTIPFIIYFSLDDFRWARHIAGSSILAIVLAFIQLWNAFCCYA